MSSSESEGVPTEPLEFSIEPNQTYEFKFPNDDTEAIILNAVLDKKSSKTVEINFEYTDFIDDKEIVDNVQFVKFENGDTAQQVELILYPSMKPKFKNNGDVKVTLSGQTGPAGCFSTAEEEAEEDQASEQEN